MKEASPLPTLGVESIWSTGANVQKHVDIPLLDHVSNCGNHGNTAVPGFSILLPLNSVLVSILKDPASQGGAFVSGLNWATKYLIDNSFA